MKNYDKRFELVDHKKKLVKFYTGFDWNSAWIVVFLLGAIFGALLTRILN